MASNFKILIYQNSENMHLKLMGDFDGSSAHQLIDQLKKHSRDVSTIFIHTSCLRRIIPFGRDVFHNNLGLLKRGPARLIFMGENAFQLSPERIGMKSS